MDVIRKRGAYSADVVRGALRLFPLKLWATVSVLIALPLALVLPATAGAQVTKHCVAAEANIHGEGASVQAEAEEKWDPSFNTSKAATACNGEQGEGGKPTVKYTKESSSVGMKKWGFGSDGNERSDSTTQFVGTDQPPNAAQILEIESQGGTQLTGSKLQTIPVVEGAIAIDVHLPAGCTVTSTAKGNTGRFVLTQAQLQEVFAGEITTWTQIGGVVATKSKAENKWTGASCSDSIKRVVRDQGSGATADFEKYLNLIKEDPAEFGGKSWKNSAEEIENTTWPDESGDPVVKGKGGTGEPATKSDGEEAQYVQEHEDTIGYSSVSGARAKHIAGTVTERSANSQEGAQIFWVEVQYGGTATKPKFTEPAKATESGEGSYDSGVKTTSNCASTEFSNGTSSAKFPPASTEDPWNEATTKLVEKTYGICALSYVLAYAKYSLFEGFTESQTSTVSNFLKFVLGTGAEEGQTEVASDSDYLQLPTGKTAKTSVLDIAVAGAERVGF